MPNNYEQQEWKTYDKTLPDNAQQEAIITKKRLDHIEEGLKKSNRSLEIGKLTVGKTKIPNAYFEEDEDEIRLNIEFPKTSEIQDNTIKDDATWSSRKIRHEIDLIAENTHYTCQVTSDDGLLFVSKSDVKTLRAKVFKTGEDITSSCDYTKMKWRRKSDNTDYDEFWNGKGYSGDNVVISADDIVNATNVTYYCDYSGLDESGATISASGNVTVSNMIYENINNNTSVSFIIDTPNGTIFDNSTSQSVVLNAIAYEGTKKIDIAEGATFKWYMNSILIPNKADSSITYPVTGLPLVATFTCEMNYNLAVYKTSVTIQNRKNVTVSETAPNDPSLGDIWYDTASDTYKKWTDKGWEVIKNPKDEVTGEVIIAVNATKSAFEVRDSLEEVRRSTYYIKDGETKYITDFYNEYKTSADTNERRMTEVETIAGEARTYASEAIQTAKKFSWIIKDGSSESSLQLTPKFIRAMSENITISGYKIALEGYTTINGAFSVDEDGYMHAAAGSTIGPWKATEDELQWIDPENEESYVKMGKRGLNFSGKLELTHDGGFTSKNFNIDPLSEEVTIEAKRITMGGISILTQKSTVGARNLILTSGNFHPQRSNKWNCEGLPWDMKLQTDKLVSQTIYNDDSDDASTDKSIVKDESVYYVTFSKISDIEGTDYNTSHFIKLPLSQSPTAGNYCFYINAFSKDISKGTILNVYLIKDNGASLMIATIPLTDKASKSSIRYNFSGTEDYTYIGFRCDDATSNASDPRRVQNAAQTFSIVNMGFYPSQISIADWQPAPEDSINDFEDVKVICDRMSITINEQAGIIEEKFSGNYIKMDDLFDGDASTDISGHKDVKTRLLELVASNSDYVTNGQLKAKVEAIYTDSIESSLKEYITTIYGDNNQEIGKIATYIKSSAEGIEISTNESNSTALKLANDSVYFVKNQKEVLATFTGSAMNIDEIVTSKITIKAKGQNAGFMFFGRSDGGLSVKKIS